jgi:hypothetical protein
MCVASWGEKGKGPGLKALHLCRLFLRGLKPSAPSGTVICNGSARFVAVCVFVLGEERGVLSQV